MNHLKRYNAKEVILTDCDGVLLDWEPVFHDWMDRNGYDQENPGHYKMNHVYGIERAESAKLIREFNDSDEISKLPELRDAKEGVAQLVAQGYTFVCITSLSLNKESIQRRIDNLESVFGKGVFEDVISLDTGADKDEILSDFNYDNFWWIEDKDSNAVEGLNHGLRPILINHEHNEGFTTTGDLKRVDTWAEIVKLVTS